MMFDKKKAASAILGKMQPEPKMMSEGGAVENVDHDFAGLHACMEDMMSAISNKSPGDMHKALSSYLELHKQLQPGEPADESPSTEDKATYRNPMF